MSAEVKELTWVSAQVPRDLADNFRRVADAHERSVSGELRQALREYVEQHKNEAAA